MNDLDRTIRIREETWQLQRKACAVDIHTHALLNTYYFGKNPMRKHTRPFFWNPFQNQVDFPRAWDGEVSGLGVIAYAIHNPMRDCGYLSPTLKQLKILQEVVAAHHDLVVIAKTAADLRGAKAQGKLAILPGVEGAHSLDADPGQIARLQEYGVCYLTLAHFLTNHFIASCGDPNPPFPGLSRLGRELVEEMNRLRILIDLSHASEKAFWEVIELSKQPVIASHTGVRAQCDIARNLSDRQIRAIADSGGVVGICLWPWYLRKHAIRGYLRWVIEHIRHCIDIGGSEAVVIGSDMDAYIWLPREMRDIADFPLITQALIEAGLPEEHILGVLGENFLKVMERTFGTQEEKATKSRKTPERKK